MPSTLDSTDLRRATVFAPAGFPSRRLAMSTPRAMVFDASPLLQSNWVAPEPVHTVDPDVVINPEQAEALLAAVGAQGEMGQHLVVFFGCMYYGALRPSEAVPLPRPAIQLPARGWGEFRLRESAPLSGSKWSDTGRSRDSRQLKHRPKGDVRVVPIAPPLTGLPNAHLREHGTAPDGRLFWAARDGLLGDKRYGDI